MIKAIETSYKGYRFRSRLEARWAVFFDAMGIEWEYEPEGFELSDGRLYLPDFKVTSPQGYVTWYEVKSKISADDGKLKQLEKDFVSHFGENECLTESFTLLCGDPIDALGEKAGFKVCPRCGNVMTYDEASTTSRKFDFLRFDVYYPCRPCDMGTPGGAGDPEMGLNGLTVTPHKGSINLEYFEFERYSMLIFNAAKKARSARFEHGERP